jgi:hypothetical protein
MAEICFGLDFIAAGGTSARGVTELERRQKFVSPQAAASCASVRAPVFVLIR